MWDSRPRGKINLANGTYNVHTRELEKSSPEWLSTVVHPIVYDPKAKCPEWDQFLAELFPEDAIALAHEVLGAPLLADTFAQEAIWMSGTGSNGKSTFAAAAGLLIGKENVVHMSLKEMVNDRFAIAEVRGKCLVVDPDSPPDKIIDASTFKKIVAGEEVRAQRKYGQPFNFSPDAKVLMGGNYDISSSDSSEGFLRRIVPIPFIRVFKNGSRQHKEDILRRLGQRGELSGIFNKVVQGLERLIAKQEFSKPESVKQSIESYRKEHDPTYEFFEKWTQEDPNEWVLSELLYEKYRDEFCHAKKISPMSANHLGTWISAHHAGVEKAQKTVDGKKKGIYRGISFKDRYWDEKVVEIR